MKQGDDWGFGPPEKHEYYSRQSRQESAVICALCLFVAGVVLVLALIFN